MGLPCHLSTAPDAIMRYVMKLSELGEFGLIDAINDTINESRVVNQPSWQKLITGIGDDAAAWHTDTSLQLATTDSLVQDVHFDLDTITWEELGWKALAINLSDIAAMGGIPLYALVSLFLPSELETEDILKFYRGMMRLAGNFGVAIAGGNISKASHIIISITLLGEAQDNPLLKRSTASIGEQIAVTGYLGLAAGGLKMLQQKMALEDKASSTLRHGLFLPVPRVKEGQTLVSQGVKTAIDISDGLVADLYHICDASNVSAVIRTDMVPTHPTIQACFPDYLNLALYGGEDYELLFTAGKDTVENIKHALDCPVTVIGEITKKEGTASVKLTNSKGETIPGERKGWEHFKNGKSNTPLP